MEDLKDVTEKIDRMNTIDIEALNDDCLINIFQYLTLKEALNIRKVCKRWNRLSSEVWRNYKILVLDHTIGDLPSRMSNAIQQSNFHNMLKIGAKYLTTVDLTSIIHQEEKYKISFDLVRQIFRTCPNINALYFTNYFGHDEQKRVKAFHYLKQYCSRLTKFGYVYQYNVLPNKDLFKILLLMKKLKHLYIDSAYDDSFFKYVSADTIEEIILENCGQFYLRYLCEVFQNSTNLHTLCSSGLTTDDTISLPKKSRIKNLGLIMAFLTGKPNWAESISEFINIEQLNIELNDNVDDRFLIALGENCKKITFLNISGCTYVTDDGTKTFHLLPKLRHLAIAGLPNITGSELGKISTLEVLDCNNCENLKDDALHQIILHSSGLRILILYKCLHITDKLMSDVIYATSNRTNGLNLHMAIGSTQINLEYLEIQSPTLKVYKEIYYLQECYSHYNAYFPTVNDFYTDNPQKPKNYEGRTYTRIRITSP